MTRRPQLSRIEFVHTRNYVHRDIKPANFVMGTDKASHLVNIIDFGLAKKFRDSRTNDHIPYHQEEHHGVGTSLFAAINTHLGIECSRRDDLESLAYMLIYFLRGTLPWRRLKGTDITQTWELIKNKKIEVESVLTLGLPVEFDILFKYARGLEFDDLPDYDGLRALFTELAEREGIKYDGVYDWTLAQTKNKKRFCEACNARGRS